MQSVDSQLIVNLCLSHDFALAGISEAGATLHTAAFEEWLSDGKYGEMEWMNRNVDVRLNPKLLVDGAKSVICVADRYGKKCEPPLKFRHGRVARYARGRDYHKEMKKRLHSICDELKKQFPNDMFRACVDTAPLLEREFATTAGIGAIGKHTLLIEHGVGSWLLLGAIVTTLSIEPTNVEQEDPCSTCTRCIDACPTDAITPWSIDAQKCVSYLTIEHRSFVDSSFFTGFGEWVFGCDVCQEVCPHNQPTEKGEQASIHSAYEPKLDSLDIAELLHWNEEQRKETLAGTSIKRAKLGMLRRNAVIVAGNLISSGNEDLLQLIQNIAKVDEDEMVRETAKAVLSQIKST